MTKPTAERAASLGAQVLLLTQQFNQFETNFGTFREEIRGWMQQRQSSWKHLWAVAVPVAGVLWFILNLQISQAVGPVRESTARALTLAETNTVTLGKIAEILPVIMQQNAASKQDRDDQRSTGARLQEVQAGLLERLARETSGRIAAEREVETQIDSMAQSTNAYIAEQHRTNANFQNALHDMHANMPAAPPGPFFFPNISGREHSTAK